MQQQMILLCRAGFEAECRAEAEEVLQGLGRIDALTSGGGAGMVQLSFRADPAVEWHTFVFRQLVFARQGFWVERSIDLGSAAGKAARVCECLNAAGVEWGAEAGVFVEAADSEVGKRLWPLCRRLESLLAAQSPAGQAGARRRRRPALRRHLFFADAATLWVGSSPAELSSPWPMGIPRLRLSGDAPSRSARKLEEALHVFLSADERPRRLKPGMSAVDLGAAPGGWSWVLSRSGVRVQAVDNAPMNRQLLRDGLVEQRRADGFTFRPDKAVDWLVCDMVAAPQRVARRVAWWAANGWCREAVFNLKLPSRERRGELEQCRRILDRELQRADADYSLRFRHLYHDREEVTAHLTVLAGGRRPAPARQRRPARSRSRRATSAAGRRRRR